ncbi:H-hydrate dehydratase [Kalaharituber pfeilii]|nr:H-hydrate dehydratase [Kalaharituber pfeilii]
MALHSLAQKELLLKARQIVPPLVEHFHKGQQGRVAVVGGCEDYTGAPYFSAIASALLGADMSHVICDHPAAPIIKSYSPNLMVHPYLRSLSSRQDPTAPTTPHALDAESSVIAERILPLFSRLHVLVVGPGLGRDILMHVTVSKIIVAARERGMGIVLDADALLIVQENPDIIRGYDSAVITPNVAEFARLCKALGVDPAGAGSDDDGGKRCAQLAKALGGVTVVQKGKKDWISNGNDTIFCQVTGGSKRSGGQGDTLTGSLGTFLAWKKAYLEKLWYHDGSLSSKDLTLLGAFGAASITRYCSRLAFEKHGRALQASDLTVEVEHAFRDLFETDEGKLEAKL